MMHVMSWGWWRGVAWRRTVVKRGIPQLPAFRISPGDSHKAAKAISRVNGPPRLQRTHPFASDTLHPFLSANNLHSYHPKISNTPARTSLGHSKGEAVYIHVHLKKIRPQTTGLCQYYFFSLTQVDMEVNSFLLTETVAWNIKWRTLILPHYRGAQIIFNLSYHFRDNVNSSVCYRWPCCLGTLDRAIHRLVGHGWKMSPSAVTGVTSRLVDLVGGLFNMS